MGKKDLELPVIDLLSSDRLATANSIHQACMDTGFFYLINHGIENELIQKALEESRNFFALPLEEKMKLAWKEHRGYTPLCSERLDTSLRSKGDLKETIYIGPLEDDKSYLNQWPSREILPSWRFTMELYYENVRDAGRRLISLIALALNLEEDFFVKDGPLDPFLRLLHYPGEQGFLDERVLGASAHSDYGMMTLLMTDGIPGLQICREKSKQPHVWENVHHISGDAGRRLISLIALALNLEEDFFVKDGPLDPFLRLLHYPGEQGFLDERVLGASAHSDYGMMTLLMTDGIPGLQICREKSKQPHVWENVHHISGAFVVNIGDMMERWTNCLYRSTLHRVVLTGQERYSMAFFLNPFPDSVVECLKSCCTEASPPRFPPIRSGDYLKERYRAHGIGNIAYDATA